MSGTFIEKYNSYDVYNSDLQTDSAESLDAVKIELQTNFRSRRNVLECTNDVFYRLMNESYCGMAYNDEVSLIQDLYILSVRLMLLLMQKI